MLADNLHPLLLAQRLHEIEMMVSNPDSKLDDWSEDWHDLTPDMQRKKIAIAVELLKHYVWIPSPSK